MHGGVANDYTALLHHFFDMAQAQWVRHVPANAGQRDFQRVVKPLEDLVQGAVDQLLAEIKHGRDCRLCLMRQNRHFCVKIPKKTANVRIVGQRRLRLSFTAIR